MQVAADFPSNFGAVLWLPIAALTGPCLAADPPPPPKRMEPVIDVFDFNDQLGAMDCQKAGYPFFAYIGPAEKGRRHYLCLISPQFEPKARDVDEYLKEVQKR